jgi:hypothetical protein
MIYQIPPVDAKRLVATSGRANEMTGEPRWRARATRFADMCRAAVRRASVMSVGIAP